MNLQPQIDAAIGAHGLWKSRLRAAATTGTSEFSPNQIRDDHRCAFGSWLFGAEIAPEIKRSKHYQACVELHRQFHNSAAEVLALALAGKKREADAAMGDGSVFKRLSNELTRAMMLWKTDRSAS